MEKKELLNDIKAKKIKPVYLFCGEDEYSKRDVAERIKKVYLADGFEDLDFFTAEDVSAGQVADACRTLPFMSEKRVVVIRNYGPFISKWKTADEPEDEKGTAGSKGEQDPIYQYIEDPEPSTCLIFYISAGNSLSSATAKALAAYGAETVSFDLPAESELAAWAARYCRRAGKLMTNDTIEHLRLVVGNDYYKIRNELDKLIPYVGERGEITVEDIEEIVPQSPEYGAFDLINKLFSQDRDGAYRTLRKMSAHGEQPSVILAGLITQLRSMLFAREAIDDRKNASQLQEKLGIRSNYAAKMYMNRASAYSYATLKDLYATAVEEEQRFKSGRSTDAVSLDKMMIMIFNAQTRQ